MTGAYMVACGRVGKIVGRVHGSQDVYRMHWSDEPGERLIKLSELLTLDVLLFDSKEAAEAHVGREPPRPVTIEVEYPTS